MPDARYTDQNGSEPPTILVAEDESLLREFVSTVLNGDGYRVLLASDGKEALELWNQEKHCIDLLLTDIIMPHEISGLDLAHLLLTEKPNLKIIYTSGYTPDLAGSDICEAEGRWFLPKPYPTNRLSELVAEALRFEPETAAYPTKTS